LHEGYLRRFAGHAAVTLVVLNQIDLLAETDRAATQEHLGRMLAEDGLVGVRVLPTSTTTGAGVDALRRELAARVAERRALLARLDADLDWVATELAAAVGDTVPRPVDPASARALANSFAVAAEVEVVTDAVAASHRRRSAHVAGWPPTRWVGRLRPDPLRRLGLDERLTTRRRHGGAHNAAGHDHTVTVPRTSRPAPSAIAEAGMDEALRNLSDHVGTGLPHRWRNRLDDVAKARRGELPDALDRAVGSVDLPTRRPGWWSVASTAQWLFTAAMVVGVVWLIVIGVVAALGLPKLPTPSVGQISWPTMLGLGGAVCGILVALVVGWAAAVGARRRAALARRALVEATASVAEQLVIRPVDSEVAALAELTTLTRRLDR
ncbi:MAG: hypothetical protein WAX12_19625, partial [Candidatus Microthrix subdominans]